MNRILEVMAAVAALSPSLRGGLEPVSEFSSLPRPSLGMTSRPRVSRRSFAPATSKPKRDRRRKMRKWLRVHC